LTISAGEDGPISMNSHFVDLYSVPIPGKPPPQSMTDFSDEVFTLVGWMGMFQEIFQAPNCLVEKFVSAVLYFVGRLNPPKAPFIAELRRLYPGGMPSFAGKPVKSYHEHEIDCAIRWHDWFYRFLSRNDLAAAPESKGHPKYFEYLASLVAERFRSGKPSPFADIDFDAIDSETLLNGIEFEADRLQGETRVLHGPPEVKSDRKSAANEPSRDAFTAYRVYKIAGKSQKETAKMLTVELRRSVSQGQVSRWCKRVAKWIEAGGLLPKEFTGSTTVQTVDPDVIDMGKRSDGHTPRQRDRKRDAD
jgi:hypothetical protein